MYHQRHFTLNEAKSLLPELKVKLKEIIDYKKILDEKNYDISHHPFFGGIGPNGTGKFPKEMEDLIKLVKEISSRGILIKDLNTGLIDFPFIRENGEEVYLC